MNKLEYKEVKGDFPTEEEIAESCGVFADYSCEVELITNEDGIIAAYVHKVGDVELDKPVKLNLD